MYLHFCFGNNLIKNTYIFCFGNNLTKIKIHIINFATFDWIWKCKKFTYIANNYMYSLYMHMNYTKKNKSSSH